MFHKVRQGSTPNLAGWSGDDSTPWRRALYVGLRAPWHAVTMDASLNLVDELRNVVASLTKRGIEYAVCGGCAVVIYGYVRATKDIDLLVRESATEPILDALRELGFTLRTGPIPFGAGTPEERRLLRATKVVGTDSLTVDLRVVTAILEEAWAGRRQLSWAGQVLTVVSREGLAKMKRLANRPQDAADLAGLGLEVITDET